MSGSKDFSDESLDTIPGGGDAVSLSAREWLFVGAKSGCGVVQLSSSKIQFHGVRFSSLRTASSEYRMFSCELCSPKIPSLLR